MDRMHHVLFLCTANSARSVLAERILEHEGGPRFRGFSAGSHPRGEVNPLALRLLEEQGLPTHGLRSKSWDEFATPGAPRLDFVFTVCDDASAETCPIWPGQPVTAHWGIPDPAAATGDDAARMLAFRQAFATLTRMIRPFVALKPEALDAVALKRALVTIRDTARSAG